MADKLYILLPVHNRREITRRFVASLKAQSYTEYHLLLLDDGSQDGTAEMVREEIERTTVLRGNGDWWWGGALQRGFEWLKEQGVAPRDLVLIMNDDTEFTPEFLERGVSFLKLHPGTLLQAQCHDPNTGAVADVGVEIDWRRMAFNAAPSPDRINCLSTRGLFLRMQDFIDIGGFRPGWLPHYFSDYEFTVRAGRRGKKLATDPSVSIRFDSEATGLRTLGTENPVEFVRRYFSRRFIGNPFAWSSFLILACPLPWKLVYLPAVWVGALWKTARSLSRYIAASGGNRS